MADSDAALESKPELELVLMIVSPNPQSTVIRVSNLTSLGGYRLTAGSSKSLHDIYLDTPDRALGRKRVNLRLRGSAGNMWITMKLSPGFLARRRHERQELEVPWSQASVRQIAGELARKGVKLRVGDLTNHSSEIEVMKYMGLQVLQDRETQREARDIVEGGDSASVVAELAIDSVLYHFGGQDVRLFELELEAKSERGRRVLESLSRDLRERFGGELKSWRFGKLVTGRKIEDLLRKGALRGLLQGTTLTQEAYDKIERA